MIGLVWASAEADILAAGGWPVAEGYYTIQFAGAGDDYPVRQEIKEMYKKEGKEPPKGMDDTVVYNRGLLQAAVHVEALKNALKATGGKQPTGEDVKKGFEAISNITLGGLVPRFTSRRPSTKAAAGSRSSRSRAASSSSRPSGSRPTAKSSKKRSRRPSSGRGASPSVCRLSYKNRGGPP